MNEQAGKLSLTVTDLRDQFDRSFAAPPPEQRAAMENLLAIRAGDGAYAVRLSEIASIERGGAIMPLPSRSPWLMGVTNLEGRIIPVFSLALLLGYPSGDETGWLALCHPQAPLALAFSKMDGYFQVPASEVPPFDPAKDKHLGGTLKLVDTTATLIHVQSLLAMIKKLNPAGPAMTGPA